MPTSAAGSWGAEQEAHAKKQRLLLDRAYRYLVDQGFGPLELASLDLDESTAMARQLATELNLPFGDWLVHALYCWLQEAREEAKIHKRAHGYHSGDLAWMSLMPPVGPRLCDRAPAPGSSLRTAASSRLERSGYWTYGAASSAAVSPAAARLRRLS